MPDPEDVLSRPAAAPPRILRYAAHETGVIDVWDVPAASATVALVHGGFWKAEYDRLHLRPLANALASHGFSVASIEYPRVGMPGGGWPGTVDSVLAGLRAIIEDEPLGSAPVVAVGHSAGGHLVALAGSEGGVEGLVGVVPLAGVLDLHLAAELGLGSGAAQDLMGAGSEDAWNAADPTRRSLVTPAIALHGDQDDVVPARLAHSWLAARDESDAAARLVELPGTGHYELIDPLHEAAFAALLRAVRELSSRR